MLNNALARLPKTLDQTYERILCSIPQEHADYAKRFLQWLTCSAQTLHIDELAEIVTVEPAERPVLDLERRFPDPEDVLTICSSLVTTNTTEKVVGSSDAKFALVEVTLAHFSVREYLVSQDIKNGPARNFAVTESAASSSIAETCLAYLLQFEDNQIYVTSKQVLSHRMLLDEKSTYIRCIFPLAHYAAKNWPTHAKNARENYSMVDDLATQLFLGGGYPFTNCLRLYHPGNHLRVLFGHLKNYDDFLPIHFASRYGLTGLVRRLTHAGMPLNTYSNFGTPLELASYHGHEDLVGLLLDNGAEVNPPLRCGTDQFLGGDADFVTALQGAACQGHAHIVRLLLDNNADVNYVGGHFGTALQVAAYFGRAAVVSLLLAANADVNAVGGFPGTAIYEASKLGNADLVRTLHIFHCGYSDAANNPEEGRWGGEGGVKGGKRGLLLGTPCPARCHRRFELAKL